MGSITVAIDAEAAGNKIAFSFDWEGNRQEIERSMQLVRETAEQGGVTPHQFAQSTLVHLPKTGLMQDEGTQQMQMMAIVFAILDEAEKRSEEIPGPILDVVADQDITATVQIRDNAITFSISGKPGKDSAYVAVH